MKIHRIEIIHNFGLSHSTARTPLNAWLAEAREANWKTSNDIKDRYSTASILAGNRVVFNIGGNKYRLVVKVNYPYKVVEIRYVSTHADYNKIDAEKI